MKYSKILDKKRVNLLSKIIDVVTIDKIYLIGGTALSLQMGLRKSYDFDFCIPNKFNNGLLLEELKGLGDVKVKQNMEGTLDIIIDGVQVSFFYFPNDLIKPLVLDDEIPKLKLASILDIAVMKLVAISSRGTKKDFFDLYFILDKGLVTIDELFDGINKKYEKDVDLFSLIIGLSYFEDAEEEILPETYVEYDWNKIKDFFIDFQGKCEKKFINK